MPYIGKSKISKIHPKPNMYYHSLCLPKACDDAIGETVHIFETPHKNCKALLVDLSDHTSKDTNSVAQPVVHPEAEVMQARLQNVVETCILAIEKEIKAIIQFHFRNAHAEYNKKEVTA